MATPADESNERRRDDDPGSQLVEMIADQIRTRGFYAARLDHLSEQDTVNVRWTAQLAGRILNRPVRTHVRRWRTGLRPTVTVIVAPTHARTPHETALSQQAGAQIERLLNQRRN